MPIATVLTFFLISVFLMSESKHVASDDKYERIHKSLALRRLNFVILSTKIASCHVSGDQNFGMAPRLITNVRTASHLETRRHACTTRRSMRSVTLGLLLH